MTVPRWLLVMFLGTLAACLRAGFMVLVGALFWWLVNGWTDVVVWSGLWILGWGVMMYVAGSVFEKLGILPFDK